jgi:hypothetical protein
METELRENKILVAVLLLCLIVVAFSFGFTPVRSSNDVWWQLKSGKYIVEHRGLPRHDVFTFTGENIEWHNHEWLAQVIMYGAYALGDTSEFGGLRGVITLKTLVLIATFLLLCCFIYMRSQSWLLAVLFALIAAAVSKRTIYPRPPVFSYLFFTGYLYVLWGYWSGRLSWRWLVALPFLTVLWANLHGFFVLGILLVGLYLVAAVLENLYTRTILHQSVSAQQIHRTYTLALLLFLCFLASLINPYGFELYTLGWRFMGNKDLVRIIPELQSPNFFFTWAFEFMIAFLLIGFAVVKRKIPSLAELFIVAIFFHLSIQHVRYLPLFGLVAAPLCGWLARELLDEIPSQFYRATRYALVGVVIIFSAYSVAHHRERESYLERNLLLARGMEFRQENYPVKVCDFIIANHFSGRMYNQINHAGYLIWRLSPEYHKVFTDSRYDVFGDTFVWEEQRIQMGIYWDAPGYNWDELLEKYAINFIVITRDAPLNARLGNHAGWRLVYWWIPTRAANPMRGYNIYVRDIPENQALITRCENSFRLFSERDHYD